MRFILLYIFVMTSPLKTRKLKLASPGRSHNIITSRWKLQKIKFWRLLKERMKKDIKRSKKTAKIIQMVKKVTKPGKFRDDQSKVGFSKETYRKSKYKYLDQVEDKSCSYCGRSDLSLETKKASKLLTIDHIIPVSKGGDPYHFDNFVVSCGSCNTLKDNHFVLAA